MTGFILEETDTIINGNWRFAFSVNATEQQTQMVNKSTEQDGIKITIERITHTPMSIIVYARQQLEQTILEEWNNINLDFTMMDDVGNVYEGDGIGSHGYLNDISTGKTFEKIDERATTLTIVPHLTLIDFSVKPGEETEEINALGESVITNSTVPAKHKEITLEPIIIELQK